MLVPGAPGADNETAGRPVAAIPSTRDPKFLFRYVPADSDEDGTLAGHLVLGKPYSVSHVKGEGKDALIYKYKLTGPGEHVDGWEQILYPLQPPH